MKPSITLVVPALLLCTFASSAPGAVLLDQIGLNPSRFGAASCAGSQDFEPAFSRFTLGVIDDFTTALPNERITSVSAALLGFNGMSNYAAITGYRVEIYSSPAAAALDLFGDLAHARLAPAEVSLTPSYAGSSASALVTLPFSFDLPGSGTYYLSIIPELDLRTAGQIGVYTSLDLQGGDNAFQANPNGGFAYAGNRNPLHASAAYKVTSAVVPEPSSAFPVAALTSLGLLLRKRTMT